MADVVSTLSATLQSGAVATGTGVLFDCGGMTCLSAQVTGSGTWTITWEFTVNDSDWVSVLAANDTTLVTSTTTSSTGVYSIPIAGKSQFRARISAWSSGSVTVRVKALRDCPSSVLFTPIVPAQGDVAHDAVDSGAPLKVGGIARSSDQTAVANADRVNFFADLTGKQVVAPYCLPNLILSGKTAAITGTSDTEIIAAQGSGIRIYVTSMTFTNSHATVGTEIVVKDATTEIFRVYMKALEPSINVIFPTPLRLTANQALNAANITNSSNTFVSAHGYSGV